MNIRLKNKSIRIGFAEVPWAEGTMTLNRGYAGCGWVLPGGVRTTNVEVAEQVATLLDKLIEEGLRDRRAGGLRAVDQVV